MSLWTQNSQNEDSISERKEFKSDCFEKYFHLNQFKAFNLCLVCQKRHERLFVQAKGSLLSTGRPALKVDMFAINKHQFGEAEGRISAPTTHPAVKV